MRFFFFLILLTTGLAGCASLPHPEGFVYQEIKTKNFTLASWARISREGKPLRVYIEGDGRAWLNAYTPSSDPTPSSKLVLSLAEKDTFPNVVYLARPCQYVYSSECRPYYWTAGRFDPKVIAAEAEGVQKLMKTYRASSLELVGYSGGAAVASLIAVRMPEVSRIVTVAGVLDHKSWTDFHGDTALTGSLNPADYKKQLAAVKQTHFAGGQDKTVPSLLTEEFVYSLKSDQAEMIIVPNASHGRGWIDVWPRLIN